MFLCNLKHSIYILSACIFLVSTTSSNVYASERKTSTEVTTHQEAPSDWPAAPSVTAESAIVMDASSGMVLYEKNSTDKKYPASITKIMTTLLAIENSSLSDTVTFSRDAVFGVDLDSSRIGIDVGEQLSMQDCLYGVMLASANEVSYAVAEHVAGNLEQFVQMMNDRAKELGAVNTHFSNPHGLQDENHYTCAYDMALISREAIKNTTFQKITGARTYIIAPTNIQSQARPLANHHKFLKGAIRYEGAIGGKTGYTATAKYTLVTYAKRGDMNLICVIMASDSADTQYSDTAALLDYGFNNFSIYNVSSSENDVLKDNPVLFTKYSRIFNSSHSFLATDDQGYVVLPNNVDLSKATKKIIYQPNTDDSSENRVIGQIVYTYKNKIVGQTNIIYQNNSSSELPTKINELVNRPLKGSIIINSNPSNMFGFIFVSIFLIFVVLIFIWYYLNRKRRKKIARRRKMNSYRRSDYS